MAEETDRRLGAHDRDACGRCVDDEREGNLVGVADPHEAGRIVCADLIQCPTEELRLVGHDSDGSPVHPGESGDHVRCRLRGEFVKVTVVANVQQQVVHVVGGVVGVRHELVQRQIVVGDLGFEARVHDRRFFVPAGREEAEILPHPRERRLFARRDVVDVPSSRRTLEWTALAARR